MSGERRFLVVRIMVPRCTREQALYYLEHNDTVDGLCMLTDPTLLEAERDALAADRDAEVAQVSSLITGLNEMQAERDAVVMERDGLRHSLEQMTISRDIAVGQRDRLESLLEAADQRLAALVGSLPRCSECDAVATWELMGGTEGSWYRCDKHRRKDGEVSHWGRECECDWAPFVRSAPVGGARGEEK